MDKRIKQMLKTMSVLTAIGLGMTSLTLTSAPAKAGGEAVAAGIIGFAAGTIVGSAHRPNRVYYHHSRPVYRHAPKRVYYPRRSAEERQYWMSVQDALNRSGYAAGPVDGAPGRMTRSAIRNFQLSLTAEPTGKLSPDQTQALFARAAEMDEIRASMFKPQGGSQEPVQTSVPAPANAAPATAATPAPAAQSAEVIEVSSVAREQEVEPVVASAAPAQAAQVEVDENGQPFIRLNGQKILLQAAAAPAE